MHKNCKNKHNCSYLMKSNGQMLAFYMKIGYNLSATNPKFLKSDGRSMKIKKLLCAGIAAVLSIAFSINAGAYTYKNDSYTVDLDIPSGYLVYNSESEPSGDNSIAKKVKSRIEDGMVIDAIEPTGKTEITVYRTSDDLSQTIGNFTPLSSDTKQSFAHEYKTGLSKNEHVFLQEPEIITVGGRDYIRVIARVGSSTGGYSYLSYVTVIAGSYYEATVYMPETIPTDDRISESEKILKSFRIDIASIDENLGKNMLSQVFVTLAAVGCSLLMVFIIFLFARRILHNYTDQKRIKRLGEMVKTQRKIRREDEK